MENGKRVLLVGFLIMFIVLSLSTNSAGIEPRVFYGRIVGIQFALFEVRGDDNRVSVFWLGYKTHLTSRPPYFGDKVRIEYIKDWLGRNAVTRIAVLKENH